jgi:hypothetical protein
MPITASPLTATPAIAHQPSQFAPASGASIPGGPKQDSSVQQQQPSEAHYYSPQLQSYHPSQSPPQSLTGKAAASQLLGPLATSPAVEQLLQQAPNADVEQLKVVAGILAQTPAAATDYQLLIKAIAQTTNGT